jgi:hypothetical protein
MTEEKPTIKDLNCGNCSVICCGFHPKCVATREPIFDQYAEAVRWFTSVWGCARHPLALRVLAAPIIEELEKRATILECREPKIGTRMENEALSIGYAEAETIRNVITLLEGAGR